MKAISLFSGVGGFEIGFERAGIETVLQAERDPWALEVLARHWPGTERVTDVRDVQGDGQRLVARGTAVAPGAGGGRAVEPDIVYGGFPCQDLSVAGKRAGLGGERSGLWFEFYRVLSELRPRWAVIENVPGLLSSNGGRDFAIILDGLDELGFDAAWAILDAQHFGVPQRRRRVFIVAGPRGRGAEQVLSLCESCGGNPPSGRAAGKDIAGTLGAGSVDSQRGWRGDLDSSGAYVATAIRTANTGSNGHGIAEDVAHTLDGAQGQAVIASTLRGRSHGDGVNMPGRGGEEAYGDNLIAYSLNARDARGPLPDRSLGNVAIQNGVRRLTPRECERLMGWPDDHTRWTADGREISDSHRYRMAGNGVVAPVAEWIGHRLVAVDVLMRVTA